ncbi:MAG: hypothetical protein CMO80_21050 [Verrucomicrobiales bacterium]|nr:hypothetical protein [Verrucomicrobiales bacterium]
MEIDDMSISDLETSLSELSTNKLKEIEGFIHRLYRDRGEGLVYDDFHGTWSEDDQIALAGRVWDDAE